MRNSLILLAAVALCSCGDKRGVRVEYIEKPVYIERKVPIPAPCPEKVTRPAEPILEALGIEPESKLDTLMQDNRVLRGYVADLEKAGLSCGVTIQ